MPGRRTRTAEGTPGHDPRLAEREARFAGLLERLGGPARVVARAGDGLGEVWRWLLTIPTPRANPWSDEALRRSGPLPAWFDADRSSLRREGPDAIWVADGLAAMVTSAILESEPDATWTVENDEFLGRVPKLKVRNGPPVPVDHGIARLVSARHANSPFEPADAEDYLSSVLEFGDPRPRSWASLTAAEARATLDLVERGHPERAQAFLHTVTEAGGPADLLDGSIGSLVPAWSWLVARSHPAAPVRDREMRRHELPWWYPFTTRYVAQQLGPELTWLVTWAADYAALVVLRAVPGARWTIGSDRAGHDFREPLLRTAAPEVDIHDRLARLLVSGHEGKAEAASTVLHDRVVQWHWVTPPVPASTTDEPPFVVEFPARGAFLGRLLGRTAGPIEIVFSDEVAHRQSRRVDRFVLGLRDLPGVTRAAREDRELVHLHARGVPDSDLRQAIDRCWSGSREA